MDNIQTTVIESGLWFLPIIVKGHPEYLIHVEEKVFLVISLCIVKKLTA